MNAFKDDKRGISAILYVILCFIVIILVTGFMDFTKKSWVLNEVQSMMDLAAHNTLKSSVDLDSLQKEILAVGVDQIDSEDLSKVSNYVASDAFKQQMLEKFKEQIDMYISTGDTIKSYEVQSINIQFEFVNWALGESSKARPQVTFDTYTKITLKSAMTSISNESVLYDFSLRVFKNDDMPELCNIVNVGTDSDGNTYLIVRNMTRLIYR